MRYSQHRSNLHDRQLAINARHSQMFSERPGIRWRTLFEAPRR